MCVYGSGVIHKALAELFTCVYVCIYGDGASWGPEWVRLNLYLRTSWLSTASSRRLVFLPSSHALLFIISGRFVAFGLHAVENLITVAFRRRSCRPDRNRLVCLGWRMDMKGILCSNYLFQIHHKVQEDFDVFRWENVLLRLLRRSEAALSRVLSLLSSHSMGGLLNSLLWSGKHGGELSHRKMSGACPFPNCLNLLLFSPAPTITIGTRRQPPSLVPSPDCSFSGEWEEKGACVKHTDVLITFCSVFGWCRLAVKQCAALQFQAASLPSWIVKWLLERQ